jgi:hypothetical protein
MRLEAFIPGQLQRFRMVLRPYSLEIEADTTGPNPHPEACLDRIGRVRKSRTYLPHYLLDWAFVEVPGEEVEPWS